MKRKNVFWKSWIVFLILLTLPGCWDLDYLKDARMVLGIALDLREDGKLQATVAVREITGGGEQIKPFNEIHSVVGDTLQELRNKLDREMSGEYRPFKNLIFLIGEDVAKRDVYPILDVVYRDPKAALTSHFAVVQGKASDVIKINKVGPLLISDYLRKVLQSDEDETYIPKLNLLKIRPGLLDPGQNVVVPYIRNLGDTVEVAGTALFHDDTFSGITLTPDETMLYLLMRGEKGKTANIKRMLNEEAKMNYEKFITVNVDSVKQKMKIEVNPFGKVKVNIHLHLQMDVKEYPNNHLRLETMHQLNRKLSKQLTMDAKRVCEKLQQAKCDAFGIGRYLIAFHPDVWKQKNWNEDYAKVQFEPKIDVEIIKHGTIQ